MRKFFLIPGILFSFAYNSYSQADIAAECSDSWGPGRYNKLKVTITFPTEEGFARFTQDFPIGFDIAGDIIPDGCDFSWNGSQLNAVWMKIPAGRSVTFSYYCRPENGMSGKITLDGRLMVIPDRLSRQVFYMKQKDIEIAGLNGLLYEELVKTEGVDALHQAERKSGESVSVNNNNPVFRVQFFSSSKQLPAEKVRADFRIQKSEKITIVRSGGTYKYQAGEYSDYESAKDLLGQLKNIGADDAFIVAYSGAKQISINEARGIGR